MVQAGVGGDVHFGQLEVEIALDFRDGRPGVVAQMAARLAVEGQEHR